MITEWNDYRKKKPEMSGEYWVVNERWGRPYMATYYDYKDIFIEYAPHQHHHPPVQITHWVQLPLDYPCKEQ